MLLKIRYELASKLFDFYINKNNFDKALPIGIVMAELFEKLEGSDKVSSAQFYARIADMHFQQGHNDKAEKLYKHSLDIATKSEVPQSDPIFKSLKANIKRCAAAPNMVAQKSHLTAAEIKAKKRDGTAKQ